ncbi:DUF7563 family protein [Halopiger djelfimassiliensis]
MPECSNCGAHITPSFVRVFGSDGDVHGCPTCMTYAEITNGDAVEEV